MRKEFLQKNQKQHYPPLDSVSDPVRTFAVWCWPGKVKGLIFRMQRPTVRECEAHVLGRHSSTAEVVMLPLFPKRMLRRHTYTLSSQTGRKFYVGGRSMQAVSHSTLWYPREYPQSWVTPRMCQIHSTQLSWKSCSEIWLRGPVPAMAQMGETLEARTSHIYSVKEREAIFTPLFPILPPWNLLEATKSKTKQKHRKSPIFNETRKLAIPQTTNHKECLPNTIKSVLKLVKCWELIYTASSLGWATHFLRSQCHSPKGPNHWSLDWSGGLVLLGEQEISLGGT